MLKRAARGLVRHGLEYRRLRQLVKAELAARRRRAMLVKAPPTPQFPTVFVDRNGTRHTLDFRLRDRLKPQWRDMCDPDAVSRPPSDLALAQRARKAEQRIAEASAVVASTAGVALRGHVLEVGCYDGSAAFQLARQHGNEVVASDLTRYYVVQRPGELSADGEPGQAPELSRLRERARAIAAVRPGSVTFVEDDITQSKLPAETFDAIVSFEVIEHLARPRDAIAGMTRLLRPGGILYHDYNPFFSINGGHSLCTLDFDWGHCRMDAEDFGRYLREVRPSEAAQAGRFYRESLNRLTLADLRDAVAAAGLEMLGLFPWFDRSLLPRITPAVIGDLRLAYPGASIDDLLATFVTLVARRP